MITEDYVSFETAKLLKEKDFDKDVLITDWWYDEKGDAYKHQNYSYSGAPVYYKETCCQAPTLQITMKWLREVHNLWIALFKDADYGWKYKPQSMTVSGEERFDCSPFTGYYSTYEQACEAAIKYCLENLI